MSEPGKLVLFHADDCCVKRLQRSIKKGHTAESWECPRCGCEWQRVDKGEVFNWEPVVAIAIFKP